MRADLRIRNYYVLDAGGELLALFAGIGRERARHYVIEMAKFPMEPGDRDLRTLELWETDELTLEPTRAVLVGRTAVEYPGWIAWEEAR
jgi:hypothetical protein